MFCFSATGSGFCSSVAEVARIVQSLRLKVSAASTSPLRASQSSVRAWSREAAFRSRPASRSRGASDAVWVLAYALAP